MDATLTDLKGVVHF